jgi:uncharacterized protein HemX
MDHVNYVVTIVVALVSGTGGWSLLQFVLTRTGRKAEVARQQAETEKLREDQEANRQSILAAAQITAQKAALDSGDKRYGELREDYDKNRKDLRELRIATEGLLDVVDTIVSRMRPQDESEMRMVTVTAAEYLAARAAIREARTHLQ